MYRGIKPQEGTGAPRAPLTCHCEERSDVAISQYPAESEESYRRNRNCLPEIAPQGHWCTARHPDVSLRGAKRRGNLAGPGWITGRSRRNRDCLPEIAPQGHFLALRAQGATSAFGLLAMTNRGPLSFYRYPIRIGSIAPGPAVPSPTTLPSTLNSRRPAGGYPRTGISSNPGRAPMPRRGSDCSRPDCAPQPPRASARRPAAGSARPTGHNTSRFP